MNDPQRTLLDGLIDYAGTAPPAALDNRAALRNYDAYLGGKQGWMLGHFLVPLPRLGEFQQAARELDQPKASGAWQLGVTIPPGTTLDVRPIIVWNSGATTTSLTAIDTIELKAQTAAAIQEAAARVPAGITVYFEVTLGPDAEELLAALVQTGARAKIRTGGLTADMIPSSSEVARFMQLCARAGRPFKASAGLHHPVRSVHPLTYQPDTPTALMHGFVNLFLAAALLYAGGTEKDAVATLEETSARAFKFDEAGVSWHAQRLTTQQLRAARTRFATSFGSCSFEEPIRDLQELGWL
jgi:hypothetical protein